MSVDSAAEEQFGPYVVYERLGVGGMATVHRALEQTEGSERMVALKRLLPHLAEDASFIKSFVREAKLASILNHVNIVQIHELGRVGTEYFISMEYIDGRDVRQLLRQARRVTGPPPMYVTVGLMIQLCDALDYAHNKADEDGQPLGLVHRDISPSNMIVTTSGVLKIIDFGIAKAQSSQLRTQTGRVKGKLAYMAPEAISGSRDLDARSDIWATGVILHELCTARPLFASKNEYQTLLKVQRGDIMPPSTFNQACPPELDAIVFRALARDADDRFANAAEMREELLRLKKQYNLQTSFKDVASWITWAFGFDVPGGVQVNNEISGVVAVPTAPPPSHAKGARPPRDSEEEEAVEVVWGAGAEESEDGPVVLDEVPDVSAKPRAKRDTENDNLSGADDIPTPLPSHGTMPSIYGADPVIEVIPQKKPTVPPPSAAVAAAALARGTDSPIARGSAQIAARSPMAKPVTGQQPVARPVTGQQPIAKPVTGGHAVVPRPAGATTPPEGQRTKVPTSPGVPPVHVDAPQLDDRMAAQRARDSVPPPMGRAGTVGDAATNPFAKPLTSQLSAEELFGNDAADVLASVSAQMESMATHTAMPRITEEGTTSPEIKPVTSLPSVPVVRFSKSMSIPVVNETMTERASSPSLDSTRKSIPITKPGIAPVATKQGIAPVSATTQPRPLTPGRAPTSSPSITTPPPVVLATKSKKPILFAIAGLLIAGGTATVVAMALSGGSEAPAPAADPAPITQPQAPVAPATGKVKFVLEPTDAEIKIEGKPVHTGSPWTTELPAGIHQIEIHRANYKSWLTSVELSANETASLRVVLEPITSAITGDASLTIATTPAGLDVYIDGVAFAEKTPIKTTLKVGPHKIVVKQNGVEVWQQNLNAEAASDYEFNPSFTDDKKRERAQRVTPSRPVTPPRPAAPAAPAPAATPEPAAPTPAPASALDAPKDEPKRGAAPPITTLSP